MPKDERGWFPARHYAGLDPSLVGIGALDHPAVRAWHEWLLAEWRPRSHLLLVTPCSSVKPYPLSPTSRKVRGVLRRLGLWDGGEPRGVEWLYLSDLLVLVPYWRAWDYPACCYELHPEELLGSKSAYRRVVGVLAQVLERLSAMKVFVVTFLPRRHLRIWVDALALSAAELREERVRYTIFGTGELHEKLSAARDKGLQ